MTQQQGLASALLAAQQALPSVGKDSQFKSQSYGYAYTSSETMIAACREVLHAAGLTLRRAGWQFDGTPEGGGLVKSQFILTHAATGESVADEVAWVAVPRGQQPIDKAVAGALTASLGYYLRDLLLVPREDENEMDKRDDSTYQPRKAASSPAKAPAAPKAPAAAPKAAPAPTKAAAAPEAPAADAAGVVEVLASRPGKDSAWQVQPMPILKVIEGKPTANGGKRWAILFQTKDGDKWASTFDSGVYEFAKQVAANGGEAMALIEDSRFGWTLYGLRTTEVESEGDQDTVEVDGEEIKIPF